jgi:PAS domain S-box-containing protein
MMNFLVRRENRRVTASRPLLPRASVADSFGLGSGSLRLLLICAALVVSGIVALAAWMSWDARRVAWDHAVQSAENIGALLEHDIRRNIDSYDLSVQAVVDGLKVDGVRSMPRDIRDMILFDRAATAQFLGSIVVIDETGAITIDSQSSVPRPGNFADRDYFAAQIDNRDLGLFISPPFFSQLDNMLEIGLSRRIEYPDGRFAGIVVGTMQLDFFRQLFDSVDIGADDTISLLNDANQIVVRKPYAESDIGKDLRDTSLFSLYPKQKSGIFEFTARRDGIARIYAFRQIGSFPLVLSIGTSERAIFAEWWEKTATVAFGVVGLTVIAGCFGVLCLVELHRRGTAEQLARESERRYRLLADYSTDMIVRASLDGVRRYVSPACRSLYGYEPSELIGTSARDYIHPDDLDHMPLITARLVAGEDKVVSAYRARRKDGSYVWVEASRRLVADPDATEPEFVVVIRDISARKEIEAALEAACHRAESANAAKSRFLANMSHELRTPLNAVIGFSDLMAREAFGPLGGDKYRIYATDIRSSGEHLLELINEVLDHAKAESGHLVLNEEKVGIAALIEFAVRMLTPRAERSGVELRSSVSTGQYALRGDERRLKQILLNLITNAIKFTPSGGHVAVSSTILASGELALSVEDTGIGIAEDEQRKIFEPFVQAHRDNDRRQEGTGLGLPVTKHLVDLHGGSLELRSTTGIGTTIVVRLPASRVIMPAPVAASDISSLGTVLVAEDDAPVLKMATAMLQRMGYVTLSAANANEALVHLQRSGDIDLLFTDMIMPPGMNGLELAEQARKLHPGIKVLLTSGFAGPAVAYDSDMGNGQAMIEKPYGFADLKQAAETLLGPPGNIVSLPQRQSNA